MRAIADTNALVADGIISPQAAEEIETRARNAMVSLGINTLLCSGILFATFGLIFWLADAIAVAVCGALMLGAGVGVLMRARPVYAMFGNAAALIGAGMLLGGAAIEMLEHLGDLAGLAIALMGAAAIVQAAFARKNLAPKGGFATAAIMVMGFGLHITGIYHLMFAEEVQGWLAALGHFYVAAALVTAGYLTNVRLITALAIAPFAQMLDTGTAYFTAAYVFYSPESTLTILQMGALAAVCFWFAGWVREQTEGHMRILALMALIVANLAALVGSIFGDVVGQTLWGPGVYCGDYDSCDTYRQAVEAFEATTLVIHEHVYSSVWALLLIGLATWAAHTKQRGLFNLAMTFGAIHAYTQAFETFYDEPLAYVIGGLAAIPLAWGLWRINQNLAPG